MPVVMGARMARITIMMMAKNESPISIPTVITRGTEGFAVTANRPGGIAQIAGEQWSTLLAADSAPVNKGDRVVVTEVRGLKLVVKKKD